MSNTVNNMKDNTQLPIKWPVALWILLLVIFWATNSVVVKFVVQDMPSAWGAFLRFLIAYPIVVIFLAMQRPSLKIDKKGVLVCILISFMSFLQIMLFNIGSQYTTGGRITMLIFTYPLIVPFIAHFLLKNEKLQKRTIIGSVIAFAGLLIPLYNTLVNQGPTLKGDLIELTSSIVLSFLIVTNKYAFSFMDKWSVFFWQATFNLFLFGAAAFMAEPLVFSKITPVGWGSLIFQALAINVFAFLSYQYILSRHNSSQVSIFFFATPLFGMLLGKLIHHEPFEISLFAGCTSVALGIFLANSNNKSKKEAKSG